MAAGEQRGAVRGEGDAFDSTFMSLEAAYFGAGFDVPESSSAVTAGEQRGAVRGKGHAVDYTSMSLEAANFNAGCGVPKPGSTVNTAGKQCNAVRGEGDA